MPCKVVLEKKADEDLAAMPSASRRQVLRAIQERLAVSPLSFGKQLRYGLTHYRSLRVGDWRIAYRIVDDTVIIAHIELRRDAYKGW